MQWKYWGYFICSLAVIAGLTYLISGFLSATNHTYVAWAGRPGETLYLMHSEWVALGGVIAFSAAFCGLPRALARLLDHPIEWWPSVLLAAYQVGLVCMLGVALLYTRKYAIFAPGALIEQRALGWNADQHSCADIRDVTMSYFYIPPGKYGSGRISDARALYVWFNDGSHWSARGSSLALAPEQSVRLGERLAEDCSLTLRYPHDVAEPA